MTPGRQPPHLDGIVVTTFGRDTLRFSRHRMLYRHWLTCAGSSAYPDKSYLALDRIPDQVIPFLEIVRLDESGEPVAEYAGEKIGEITGIDFTGRRFSEVGGGASPAERMKWCFRFGVPYMVNANMVWGDGPNDSFSALVLPFGGNAETVERLAVGLEFSHGAMRARQGSEDVDLAAINTEDQPTRLEQA